ncbi:MAG: response regulator transcription factor [Acidobacteria bacterium]|nr:response regulator transcription factor [Acidobacteriota bacterium]MCA1609685.1 response regulator transcription factor [Acidobacteriota bacterium]
MGAPIRVCLVDDQTLVREGIRSLLGLAEGIEVVAEAADGTSALAAIETARPDLVLLDLRMPNLSGIQVLEALSERGAPPPTIVLTTFDDEELVVEAFRAGARGFLLKDVSLEGLVRAIHTVMDGGTVLAPVLGAGTARSSKAVRSDFPRLEPPDALTAREIEVLRLMARGESNREIARALFVAEGTVKNHVSSILSKLGVRDRTRAVLQAIKSGAIE